MEYTKLHVQYVGCTCHHRIVECIYMQEEKANQVQIADDGDEEVGIQF